MGQFIFIEHYADLPLLAAFCDFLVAADPAFRWQERMGTLRAADLEESVMNAMAATAKVHPEPPQFTFYEGAREWRDG